MNKLKLIILLTLSSVFNMAFADPLPSIVHDPKSLAEAAIQTGKLAEQITALNNQLTQLASTHNALTQIENYDDFFEFVKDNKDYWDWSPELEVLMEIAGGDYHNDSLSEQIRFYNEKYGEAWDPSDFDPNYNEGETINYNAILYSDQAKAVRSALGMSHEAFNRTMEFYDQYEDQRDKIGVIDTLKKSADYNNHLQLELAAQLNDMIKIMSQQLSMMALMLKQQDTSNEFNTSFFQSADYDQ